jgi:hypothetical protein
LDQANTIALDAAGDVWVNGIAPSADFPATGDTVAAALALDPGGVLHAAGDTGLVSAISSGGKPGPRIFGLASAAGGSLAGRVAPVELISIYCLDLGPALPVSATFDADRFPAYDIGRNAGDDRWHACAAALRFRHADQCGRAH